MNIWTRKSLLVSLLTLTMVLVLLLPASILALFTNGGFETGDFTTWTKATFLNPGLTGSPPFTGANIVRNSGGTDYSVVFGPFAPMSQGDSQTGNVLMYPPYGSYSARVNGPLGNDYNANSIVQQTTVGAGDVDPLDGLVHLRFVYAPVLEEPGHPPADQAWMYIVVKNITKGTTIFEKFIFAGEPGIPWKIGAGQWLYVDWTLVDLAPGAGQLDVGDTVEAEVIGSGCAYGAHAGYVHVDEFGPMIPGVTVVGSGPSDVGQGADLSYSFIYRNGGSAQADNVVVTMAVPAETTFVSVSDPACSESGGVVTCNLGSLGAGASGAFSVVVHVTAGAVGPIVNGTYDIGATGMPTLLGPAIYTTVSPQAPTTTLLSLSPNPSQYSETVALVATVGSGGGMPTGDVIFREGSTILGTVALSGGTAQLDISTLTVDSHPNITAEYTGAPSFAGSVSDPQTQVVLKADTTTGLVVAPNPSKYGQEMIFTATVQDRVPASPSGTLTFYDGGVLIPGCIDLPLVSLTATCDPGVLGAGLHSVTAGYSGDPYFNGSTSPEVVQDVQKADTTTALSSSVNPSMYGTMVTFTAMVDAVAPGSGIPDGTVSFYDGSVLLSTIALDGTAVAEFTTSYPLAVGIHNIRAGYNGSAHFNPSTAPILHQRVEWATDLTIEKSMEVIGRRDVTFTVVVRNIACCCVSAPGAIVSDKMPANVLNATWTCRATGGAKCGATSGTGDIYDVLEAFPPGGMVTYTVRGRLADVGHLTNTAEILVPEGVRDIDMSNNSATCSRWYYFLPFAAQSALSAGK